MSIKIVLSDKLVLTNDSRQFILNRRSYAKSDQFDPDGKLIRAEGDEVLSPFKFWGNFEALLNGLPMVLVLASSDAQTLAQLAADYKKAMDAIMDQIRQ